MERGKFLGENGRPIVKTAETIGIPFGLWAWIGRRNHVLQYVDAAYSYRPSSVVCWSVCAEGRCHGNQFWDAIWYYWIWRLMGYNFGCMIASDTQFDSRGGFSG